MDVARDLDLLEETASVIATAAEQSGFDSLWLTDRVVGGASGVTRATGATSSSTEIGVRREVDQNIDQNHDQNIDWADRDTSNTDPAGSGSAFEAYSMLGALATRTTSM